MSRRTSTKVVDDIDGSVLADGTASTIFSFGGYDYRIDLSAENSAAFETALAPYINAARELPRNPARRPSTDSAEQRRAIRAWAQDKGIPIGDRGRIPHAVAARFEQEHRR